MKKNIYKCIGVMTGNSLDAVDIVYTKFQDEKMEDIANHSKEIPINIANDFRKLKSELAKNNGDINFIAQNNPQFINDLEKDYISLIAETILELINDNNINTTEIDAIGFHGQTVAHCPPSIAKSRDVNDVYTLQFGNGQMLADLLNIPVIFDFRSDDIMNLGEGAPLAPIHNQHIAKDLKTKNIFPVAFCNAGNTGNIAVISNNTKTEKESTYGWDTGPFNHFIDYLMRTERNLPCDFDGKVGSLGKINYELLEDLFDNAVRTKNDENFILAPPPKSSDPAWYKIIPALIDKNIPFVDRCRTAEFFSAYSFVYNLSFIPKNVQMPKYFLTFGGGWKNPIIMNDFRNLIIGNAKVLDKHNNIFNKIKNPDAIITSSDEYGYNGQFMEARIFADMAKCFLTDEPFSYPETTGNSKPTIGGTMTTPNKKNKLRWSRAEKGWAKNKYI